MPLSTISRPRSLPILLVLLAAAAALLVFSSISPARGQSRHVVNEADNATLGRTILTTTKGRTLYSLSSETKGRFHCTGDCLASWRPLIVAAGVKPQGPVRLGTVKRPNGKIQVTYKGLPLYSFNGDVKSGEVNGEGLKDVGTWHAASVAQVNPPPPTTEPPPYPY